MIIPIFVTNSVGEYVDTPLLYSIGINECDYLSKLFNNQSIVVDRYTMNYIDFKYNSLPILYDKDYTVNPFGFINIHDSNSLYSYSEEHSDNTFILSTLNEFYSGIEKYCKLYIVSNNSIDMIYGYEAAIPLDFSNWVGTGKPVYEDVRCKVYCLANISHILSLYSKSLKRPLYTFEKEIILNIYTSEDYTIQVPSYIPLINI